MTTYTSKPKGYNAISPYLIVDDPARALEFYGPVSVISTAVAKGAKILAAVEDKFYGDRVGSIQDPFGHIWSIAQRKENLLASEVQRRANQELRNQ